MTVRGVSEPAPQVPLSMSARCLAEPLDRQIDRLSSDWRSVIDPWRHLSQGSALIERVDASVAAGVTVYPPQVFRALELTPLAQTRVVILGQDPYHSDGQAEGLAFSVPPGARIPPSLRNIFKELQRDVGVAPASSGHLGGWALQGVLLLNSSLTVEDASPASHAKWGWHELTDKIVRAVAQHAEPKVFRCGARTRSPRHRSFMKWRASIWCCSATIPRRSLRTVRPSRLSGAATLAKQADFFRSSGLMSRFWTGR